LMMMIGFAADISFSNFLRESRRQMDAPPICDAA
jgi:hypothetical protein